MRVDDTEIDGFDGTDATGAVRVVTDRSGLVTDVVVTQHWREKVRPHQLALALTTAVNEALASRLMDHLTHTDLEPEVTPRKDARDARGNPSGEVAQRLKAEIAGLLAAFERDLETYRRELSEAVSATVSARSPKGAVEVTMGHGQAVQVTVDLTWAKSARHNDVRAETLAAFQVAGQRLATVPRAVTPPPSMARLRELARDPAALNRELGLP
jgi:hypothetical protein